MKEATIEDILKDISDRKKKLEEGDVDRLDLLFEVTRMLIEIEHMVRTMRVVLTVEQILNVSTDGFDELYNDLYEQEVGFLNILNRLNDNLKVDKLKIKINNGPLDNMVKGEDWVI